MKRLALIILAAFALSLATTVPASAGTSSPPKEKAGKPTPTQKPAAPEVIKANQVWKFSLGTEGGGDLSTDSNFQVLNPVDCWGYTTGGYTGSTNIWGAAYQSCTGLGINLQMADVRIIWCVAVILGTCNPASDQGQLAYREIETGGGFWTPAAGSATRSVTAGRSYMIKTVHHVFHAGGYNSGTSTSGIFYVSG